MNWNSCYCLLIAVVSAGITSCHADEFLEVPPQVKTYDLTLSPAAEPKPVLKYRLLPLPSEVTPGNAAIHYHRALQLFAPTYYRSQEERRFETEWFGQPYEKLPVAEVREWLKKQKLVIDALVLASRCESCDWGIRFQDLRGPAVIEIPLPELQNMRQMARILGLKATLEIGEKRFDEALETLKVQYSLSRNLGTSPNLIANLVAIAVEAITNDSLINLMASEGSPNLYWALRDLPHPLIDIRPAARMEATTLARLFPFLDDAEKVTRSPEEWRRLLFDAFVLTESGFGTESVDQTKAQMTFDALMTRNYPVAKRELIASGSDAEAINKMPPGQVISIYARKCHQEVVDQFMKWMLVPYSEGHLRLKSVMEDAIRGGYMRSGPDENLIRDPLLFNSRLVFAAVQCNEAGSRQPRLRSAMIVVEAIRMFASGRSGKLPANLAEITEVTLPNDPVTGKPFLYRVINGQAELLAPPTTQNDEYSGRRFRLKLR